jgi:hypothetical protein
VVQPPGTAAHSPPGEAGQGATDGVAGALVGMRSLKLVTPSEGVQASMP